MEPPSILKVMGIIEDNELWEVECALYGFQESPEGHQMSLKLTPDAHVWQILQDGQVQGLLTTYVDDLLAAGSERLVKEFFREIKTCWKCSEEEMVTSTGWMRYCGYDLRSTSDGGFILSQGICGICSRRGTSRSPS